ncbi:MAG: hypothetical protein RQ936_06250 [Gammaproteobacteria bacterium]|nr:hypothetical protein [Gammaproteobacteria bacterium]
MFHLFSRITGGLPGKVVGAALLSFFLISCTDTDGPPEDIFGVAASGAPITGMVYVVDSAGIELSKTINFDGSYKLDVRKMTAPFMLKVVADDGTVPDLYSFAEQANVTANLTPMTNLALFIANGNADPAVLYDSWPSSFVNITAAGFKEAQAIVNANLNTPLTAFALDPFTYDFVGTRFTANGTGIDGLLDAITLDISGGVIDLSIAGLDPLVFDTAIVTTDYDIGADSVAVTGNYVLRQIVTIDGLTSRNITLTINFPAALLPTVDNAQIVEEMFVSFYGTKGTITFNALTDVTSEAAETVAVVDATIKVDGVDKSYSATYTFTLNP